MVNASFGTRIKKMQKVHYKNQAAEVKQDARQR